MRASSVDDWWEILAAEHRAQGHDVPKLDRFLYRLALAWLRWRLRRATR